MKIIFCYFKDVDVNFNNKNNKNNNSNNKNRREDCGSLFLIIFIGFVDECLFRFLFGIGLDCLFCGKRVFLFFEFDENDF